MAVSMAFGPMAGLPDVEALAAEPSLERYHLLPSARADLLAKLGRLTRLGRSSSVPRRSRTMRGREPDSSNGPRRAAANRRVTRSADSRPNPRIVDHEPLRVVSDIGLEAIDGEGLEPYEASLIVDRSDERVPLRGSMHCEVGHGDPGHHEVHAAAAS